MEVNLYLHAASAFGVKCRIPVLFQGKGTMLWWMRTKTRERTGFTWGDWQSAPLKKKKCTSLQFSGTSAPTKCVTTSRATTEASLEAERYVRLSNRPESTKQYHWITGDGKKKRDLSHVQQSAFWRQRRTDTRTYKAKWNKYVWGSGGIDPVIINPDNSWSWEVSFSRWWHGSRGKISRRPRSRGWILELSGGFRVQKYHLPLNEMNHETLVTHPVV